MNIGFFVRHFGERGTETSVYDYAHYNEIILKNKSYILCLTQESQAQVGLPLDRFSYDKFKSRFEIIELTSFVNMPTIIKKFNLSFFYTQAWGGEDFYEFNKYPIWSPCKTIKHCVFSTDFKEGDFYISISDYVNENCKTNYPVIPYIVERPNNKEDLRNTLNIPIDATIFGRHGGLDTFNLDFAHLAIKEFLETTLNTYFIFMNTKKFYEHPRIIYLEKSIDSVLKEKFVNTCDAMIHARSDGETFGHSIAEFSIRNKPIITCPIGALEHIKILGDKAIIYRSQTELVHIFKNIKMIKNSKLNWNAYEKYTPEYVMNLFNEYIFSKV